MYLLGQNTSDLSKYKILQTNILEALIQSRVNSMCLMKVFQIFEILQTNLLARGVYLIQSRFSSMCLVKRLHKFQNASKSKYFKSIC